MAVFFFSLSRVFFVLSLSLSLCFWMMIFSPSLFFFLAFFVRNRKKKKRGKLCRSNNTEIQIGRRASFSSIFSIITITKNYNSIDKYIHYPSIPSFFLSSIEVVLIPYLMVTITYTNNGKIKICSFFGRVILLLTL